MDRPNINPGKLIWSGQHWINYLRRPGEEIDSGKVSLYRTHYSPAGEGTLAFIVIPGDDGFSGICTDNPNLLDHLNDIMQHPFDPQLPVHSATFTRSGQTNEQPAWTVETETDKIVATWKKSQPEIITEGWAPYYQPGMDYFTLLFFVDEAEIVLNGKPVDGVPYSRDSWSSSIGGERSSCLYALAETMIQTP
jgi:hypothetical protein